MTELTAVLHLSDPVGLRLHSRCDAVALRTRAGEFAGVGHLDEGVPVVGGVDRGRGLRRRRYLRLEVDRRPR